MEQVNLFELIKETYRITKPIRLIELFAGIGAQAKALKNLQVPFEHHRVIEIDRHAINSYNAVFGTDFDVTDITKVKAEDLGIRDTESYEYVLTYSFPCQDLSKAGSHKGMKKGSGTRSGLLWEVERILKECETLPQILLMENVPDVMGKNNIQDFHQWLYALEKMGYSNYAQCLNAKNYGIPQSRNRAFMVSIHGDYFYRFPKKMKLQLRLKDMLEEQVSHSYYLNADQLRRVLCGKYRIEKQFSDIDGICFTLTTKQTKIIGNLSDDEKKHYPCVLYGDRPSSTGQFDGILVQENTKKGFAVAKDGDGIYIDRPFQKRGVVQDGMIPTLKTSCRDLAVVSKEKKTGAFYVRYLTPLECWRLMGFSDEDYLKAASVTSASQLYKQAGNSIVVNVLEAIFSQLL